MHVFHFKMHISAVFCLIAMNLTPYSPTVTWYMCAKFAAFPTFGTKGVNVWVFGQVVVTTLYPKGLTIWVAMRKLFIMTNGACITSFMQIAPS